MKRNTRKRKVTHHWSVWHWSGWYLAVALSFGVAVYFFTLADTTFQSIDIPPARAAASESEQNSTTYSCIFERADFNHDGLITTADVSIYISHRANNNPAADINNDGINGNTADNQCMEAFLADGNLLSSAQILSPVPNASIQGVVPIRVRAAIFPSLQYVTLFFRPVDSTTPHTRPLVVSNIRNPEIPTEVNIPFDTLAMTNGPVEVWICPNTSSDTNCSDHVTYTITNDFRIVEPTAGATVNGTQVRFSTSFSLNASSSTTLGPVTKVFFTILVPGNSTPVWESFQQSRDSNFRYAVQFDSTAVPNGTYMLRVSYRSFWQESFSTLLSPTIPVVIHNAATNIPSGPPSNINSPATNTNTAPVSNTNTAVVPINTNRPISNTNTTANTNSTPATNTATPSWTRTVIEVPQSNVAMYDLPYIIGRNDRGSQVSVTLKRNAAVAAGDVAGCGFVGGETVLSQVRVAVTAQRTFAVPVTPLQPGAYSLGIAPIDGNQTGPISTACFRILPPRITVATEPGSTLTGSARLDAYVFGSLQTLDFKATFGSLPVLTIGRAAPVPNTRLWTTIFNTASFPSGSYSVFAQGTTLDGVVISSEAKTLTVVRPSQSGTTDVTTSPATIVAEPDIRPVVVDSGTAVDPVTAATTTTAPAVEDPRETGTTAPETLFVNTVTNVAQPQDATTDLTLSGIGPPDSIVTIFIYSDPIVVTTKTDANGNWTYSLDQDLADGRHEVYVTITDETGKITSKSNPLSFFVAEAQAVSEEDFVRHTAETTRPSDTYLYYYLAIAGLLVVLTIIVFLIVRMNRHSAGLAKA